MPEPRVSGWSEASRVAFMEKRLGRPLTQPEFPGYMRFDGNRLGPYLAPICGPDETVETPSWRHKWLLQLIGLVRYEGDAWGIVGMRPDGDYRIFEADEGGAARAVDWAAVRVWLLFPEWPT